MTTVLTLIQDFTDKMGLPTPTALIGSQEKSVRQYRSLLREVIQDLAEYRWPEQTFRHTWSAVAGSDQGYLTDLFPGIISLTAGTLWFADRRLKIIGPLTEQAWQARQVLEPNNGLDYTYWLAERKLFLNPSAILDEQLSVVFTTKYCVLDVDGNSLRERVTADDDSLIFPDVVVNKAFEYKWRKQKGEDGWQNDYNAYMAALAKNVVGKTAARLCLDTPSCYDPCKNPVILGGIGTGGSSGGSGGGSGGGGSGGGGSGGGTTANTVFFDGDEIFVDGLSMSFT